MIAGFGGVRRNAAVALSEGGRIVAACEQERVTRVRDIGIGPEGMPREALHTALQTVCREPHHLAAVAAAEPQMVLPPDRRHARFDHHFAHAAAAAWTSPWSDADVLVCDNRAPFVSAWRVRDGEIARLDFNWAGAGLANVYARATRALGLVACRDEHRLEALARHCREIPDERALTLARYHQEQLTIEADFDRRLAEWAGDDDGTGTTTLARLASAVESNLCSILVEVVRDVRALGGGLRLCLGGGLFYNTRFTTAIRRAAVYPEVFVPIHPGNPGLAPGVALAADPEFDGGRAREAVAPFLGPEYSNEQIKAVLDNCKLSYDYLNDTALIARCVDALLRGRLVGWFEGRMEWGPRALGHRSILANPFCPHVLDNLNVFLKRRERYRPYGVSVRREDAPQLFEDAHDASMQYEHQVRDPCRFRHLMPAGPIPLRVHTVDHQPERLRELLRAFGDASGTPALVNTSFNGFHEPMVCSPRDAVRVFYGTGLDLLVIGNFNVRK
jgi:carbamoyltransferase